MNGIESRKEEDGVVVVVVVASSATVAVVRTFFFFCCCCCCCCCRGTLSLVEASSTADAADALRECVTPVVLDLLERRLDGDA
jgi:hypothetical protein